MARPRNREAGFQGGSNGKNSHAGAGDDRDFVFE